MATLLKLQASKPEIGHCVIVNDVDAPENDLIAIITESITDIFGKQKFEVHYLVKPYNCRAQPRLVTPIDHFGRDVMFSPETKRIWTSTNKSHAIATYPDGTPRRWQGRDNTPTVRADILDTEWFQQVVCRAQTHMQVQVIHDEQPKPEVPKNTTVVTRDMQFNDLERDNILAGARYAALLLTKGFLCPRCGAGPATITTCNYPFDPTLVIYSCEQCKFSVTSHEFDTLTRSIQERGAALFDLWKLQK